MDGSRWRESIDTGTRTNNNKNYVPKIKQRVKGYYLWMQEQLVYVRKNGEPACNAEQLEVSFIEGNQPFLPRPIRHF
jgi:hypothetical protein